MFDKLEKYQLVLLALILALGLIFATKSAVNSLSREGISVTGSAYEIVKSDSGRLSFTVNTQALTKAEAYQILRTQMPVVTKYLQEKGIENIDIKNYNGYYTYKYNRATGNYTNEVDNYKLSQPVEISSNDVNKIKEISLDIQNLLDKGIDINVNQASYFYSKLGDLKVNCWKMQRRMQSSVLQPCLKQPATGSAKSNRFRWVFSR